ncbi:hypothetical protein ACFL5A_03920 [Gemmatimonadota bacterium]
MLPRGGWETNDRTTDEPEDRPLGNQAEECRLLRLGHHRHQFFRKTGLGQDPLSGGALPHPGLRGRVQDQAMDPEGLPVCGHVGFMGVDQHTVQVHEESQGGEAGIDHESPMWAVDRRED